MTIWNLSIDEITGYEKNAKIHSEKQVGEIAESLKQFGWKQPLVVDRNHVLIAGHGSFLAAKRLKMSTVPCVIADDLTDEQVKMFRLVDNKTAESGWDYAVLDDELTDIAACGEINMEDFGFTDDEEVIGAGNVGAELSLDSFGGEKYECCCPECGFVFNP